MGGRAGQCARRRQAAGRRALLQLDRYDSKGQNEEALSALRAAMDDGARIVLQGNSSATAAALIDAIDKNNERDPARRVLFLNYSAVDPALTNERCSFWHFRFDAHADMRVTALMDVAEGRQGAQARLPDRAGLQLRPGGAARIAAAARPASARTCRSSATNCIRWAASRTSRPMRARSCASGAQAVITGNWGNDLTLLVKAAREAGFNGTFYTFYGNALGAPAAIGDAGIGRVVAVADWLPNVQTPQSEAFYQAFRERFPKPADDYVHMRMHLMIEALAQAIERAGSIDTVASRARSNRPTSRSPARAATCAPPTTSSSRRSWSASWTAGHARREVRCRGIGLWLPGREDHPGTRAEMPTSCKMNRAQ